MSCSRRTLTLILGMTVISEKALLKLTTGIKNVSPAGTASKPPEEKCVYKAENKRGNKNDEGKHPELSSRRAAVEVAPPPHYSQKLIHKPSPSDGPMRDGTTAFSLPQDYLNVRGHVSANVMRS